MSEKRVAREERSGAAMSLWAKRTHRAWSRLAAYAFALGMVLLASGLAEALYDLLHFSRVSGIFLIAILVTAVRYGPLPALWAAALAFLAYVFFTVEPRFTLQVDTQAEIVNLVVFFVVALITGRLAGQLKIEVEKARERALKFSILFEAGRELSALAEEDAIRLRLAVELSKAVRGRAEVIWSGRTWASDEGRSQGGAAEGWSTRELEVAGRHLGVCRWRATRPDAAPEGDLDLVDIIVDLGAAALARVPPLKEAVCSEGSLRRLARPGPTAARPS